MKDVVVILDNIRSAHNVGSIFRTCDGAGVKKVFLVGITPAPVDRFGREQPEIKKTSLSATESMSWEKIGAGDTKATNEASGLIRRLKGEGYSVIAIEQTTQSISLTDFTVPKKVVYIFGAEVEGVQAEILNIVDHVIDIPMQGKKESLNVSVTAGIVLFLK